jgi:hypothetical protein
VRPGSGFRPFCRLSGGSAEVESRGGSRAEVHRHRLGVVRVDVHAGRGQRGVEADRAAEGVAHVAAAVHAVDVQLEGGAGLLALEYILDHPVGHRSVLVGHVDRGGASAVAEAGDVAAEGDVLTLGLTNGGDVDLGAVDLEGPVADLTHGHEVGVGDLELVGGNGGAVVGDGKNGAAGAGRDGQFTGGSGVAEHVIGGGCRDRSRQGAGAGAAGLAVNHAEFHGVAHLEIQVGLDRDGVGTDIHARFTERAGGASGLVVKSAGRAGQNGGGHWRTRGVVTGRALPGLLQVSACNSFFLRQHGSDVGSVDSPHKMGRIFSS